MLNKEQIHKLDNLASVKALKSSPRCMISGARATEVHHIFGRSIMATRFYLPNLMPINRLFHSHNEKGFHEKVKEKFIERYGQLEWDELDALKQGFKACIECDTDELYFPWDYSEVKKWKI